MQSKKNYKELLQTFLNKSGKQKITIVVLIGILLIVIALPVKKNTSSSGTTDSASVSQGTAKSFDSTSDYEEYLEKKLEGILAKADGVGKVEVTVTLKSSSEKIIANDNTSSEQIVN